MNKSDYLTEIRNRLKGVNPEYIDRSLDYYSEMIDDRMEDGLTEEEAIAKMDDPKTVANQILMDQPLSRIVEDRIKPNSRINGWEIALILLGSPLWLPLLIAAFAIAIAFVITAFSLLLSFFAIVFSLGLSGIAGVISAGAFLFTGHLQASMFACGVGFIAIGGFMLLFITIKPVSIGFVRIVEGFFNFIKKSIIRSSR